MENELKDTSKVGSKPRRRVVQIIGSIIDGISQALTTEFGDTCLIYTEDEVQGLNKPCFTIHYISNTSDAKLGNRYQQNYIFSVIYSPISETERRKEMYEVQQRIESVLEYINVNGNQVRAKKMQGEILNNVYVFNVNYDMIVYKQMSSSESMGYLNYKGE